jgi:hypothetical protein
MRIELVEGHSKSRCERPTLRRGDFGLAVLPARHGIDRQSDLGGKFGERPPAFLSEFPNALTNGTHAEDLPEVYKKSRLTTKLDRFWFDTVDLD